MKIAKLTRLIPVLCILLIAVGCSCRKEQEETGKEPHRDAEQITVTLPPESTEQAVPETDAGSFAETTPDPVGTPNAEGLYNDPDTKATPEPKYTYAEYRSMNEDVIGWVSVPNTTIDYPVLYNGTNYYINHSPSRNRSDYGAVYLYEECTPRDNYRILFGHAMKDGSMFAPLHNFTDREFFEHTTTFQVTDGDDTKTYRIFSAFVCDVDTDYPLFMNLGMEGEEYVRMLESLLAQSQYEAEGEFVFTKDSQVVCLVTCNRVSYANGREVVLGLLIPEA